MPIRSLLILCFTVFAAGAVAQQSIDGRLSVGDKKREYMVHLPVGFVPQQHLPVVFIFHGGGGNSRQVMRYFAMDPISDREKFITVYPNGIAKQWNDGREFKESISTNDDVKFIDQLIDTIVKRYNADSRRIFATGISNGGFFSLYLSFKLSHRFLAIAPVCASIPERLEPVFYPSAPLSLLLINGVNDPIVPYSGGTVGNFLLGDRGNCISTDSTIARYLRLDQITSKPIIENIPNLDKSDGCAASRFTYKGGIDNTRVCLIKITGGGHTLPGGKPYLPRIVGNVCNDFPANEMIWAFFRDCTSRQ